MDTIFLLLLILVSSTVVPPSSSQITTACMSLASTLTPCLISLNGSTNGTTSPRASCCQALANIIEASRNCACLLLTGNVPLNLLPPNTTLADLPLPTICSLPAVPLLQCKGVATQLPPPGPVPFGPSLPPLPPMGVPSGSASAPLQSKKTNAQMPSPSPSTGFLTNPRNESHNPEPLPQSAAMEESDIWAPCNLPIVVLAVLCIL